MLTVSATKLCSNLFEYLDKLSAGEVIIIQRNNEEVGRIVPTQKTNWRDKMPVRSQLLVHPDELINPIEDIWEGHVS
ncbi:MAG: type II toxin-antitoxin system prevent-host-death family antitoxin [Chloroflexota bacterium]